MKLGKPDFPVLSQTIFRKTGSSRKDVILGPTPAVDTSIIRVSNKRVLVASSDPISLIPELGPQRSAFLSVQEIASDLATSGLRPEFAMFTLNLPTAMNRRIFRRYWESVHLTCKSLGISIVGGHTGSFQGINYAIIGSGTLFSIGYTNGYVTSQMAKDGDDLIITKTVALEAAAILSTVFRKTVTKRLGSEIAENAESLLESVGVVEDATLSASVGLRTNVRAMHDVAEGGLFSAVADLSEASGLKATIDLSSVPVSEEVEAICRLFHINPYSSLGSGSLLIVSRPQATRQVIRRLRNHRINASVIGSLSRKGKGNIILKEGRTHVLKRPKSDPYWKAFWKASVKGLK